MKRFATIALILGLFVTVPMACCTSDCGGNEAAACTKCPAGQCACPKK